MAGMRYRLRTLLILLAILPPLLAVGWWRYSAWRAEQLQVEELRAAQLRAERLRIALIEIEAAEP